MEFLNTFGYYDLDEVTHYFLGVLMVGSSRVLGAFIMLSVFGTGQIISRTLRIGIAMSLVIFLMPLLKDQLTRDIFYQDHYTVFIIKESLIGAIIGLIVGLPFYIAGAVGTFIDNQRGAGQSQMSDPISGSETGVLGVFINKGVVAIFFVAGGFFAFLDLLYSSYILWPITDLEFDWLKPRHAVISHVITTFAVSSLLLASPAMISMFLSELSLALLNRFAKQLNVFILAMPIKSMVACLVLMAHIPIMMYYFQTGMTSLQDEKVQILKAIR